MMARGPCDGAGLRRVNQCPESRAAVGIPIHDPAAFPFMWIKGIRDNFAGLVNLAFS
jgi:hypothetical protein